jgi:hypothetical protein
MRKDGLQDVRFLEFWLAVNNTDRPTGHDGQASGLAWKDALLKWN